MAYDLVNWQLQECYLGRGIMHAADWHTHASRCTNKVMVCIRMFTYIATCKSFPNSDLAMAEAIKLAPQILL